MQFPIENQRVKLVPLKASDCDSLWLIAKNIDIFEYGSNDISSKEKQKAYNVGCYRSTGTALAGPEQARHHALPVMPDEVANPERSPPSDSPLGK